MQLELRDYFNVLIKRWWIILLVVIGAAAAGLGYSLAQTPIYRAQVQMEAIPNRPDNGLVEYLVKSLPSYVTGLQSRHIDGTRQVFGDRQGEVSFPAGIVEVVVVEMDSTVLAGGVLPIMLVA